MADPSAASTGDSLAVRLRFRGRPLANAHVHAGIAFESAPKDSASTPKDLSRVTDTEGVVQVPLAHGGLWNVHTLHAAPVESGATGQWDVHFATLVFRVGGTGHSH